MKLTDRFIEAMGYEKSAGAADYRWDSELPGFGVRVYPSGRKSFLVSYRTEAGRKRFHTLADVNTLSVTKARRLATRKLSEVRLGADPQAERQAKRSEITVRELAGQYLGYIRHHKLTWERERDYLDQIILPRIGNRKLSEVTYADLERIQNRLIKTSTPSVVNNVGSSIRGMFKTAVRWQLLSTSPAHSLRNLPPPPPRDILLTPQQCRRILVACDFEKNPFGAAGIRLALYTGRRHGELLGLKWRDVDFDRKVMKVRAGRTHDPQFVYLSEPAMDALRSVPRVAGNPYVLAGTKEGRPQVDLKRPWRRVLRRAGLPHFPFHGLRHNYASTLIAAGVSIEAVRLLLGHRRIGSTLRYIHHRPLQLHEAAQVFVETIEAEEEPARASPTEPVMVAKPTKRVIFPAVFDRKEGEEPESGPQGKVRDMSKSRFHIGHMSMGDRIRLARKELGVSQQAIGNRFEISRAAVAQWEAGDTGPNTPRLGILADMLGVRLEWLVTGQGPMHPGQSSTAWDAGFRPVPVIDFTHAGHIADYPGVSASTREAEFLAADASIGSEAFALVIEDNSMAPEFSPGDKIIVDPDVTPMPGDYVAATIRRGISAVFRKLRTIGVEPVEELVPLNDDWPVTRCEPSGKIIGTMVEHRRYRRV